MKCMLPNRATGNATKTKEASLSDALNGDHLVDVPYEIRFLVEYGSKSVCKMLLNEEETARFRSAVASDYYFKLFLDDLPSWGFVGTSKYNGGNEPTKRKYFLYTEMVFEILYNNDSVIEVHVLVDYNGSVEIVEEKNMEVEFSYTVKWRETSEPFEKRMDTYMMYQGYLETRWFSTMEICVTVVILTIILAMYLVRVLKNDFVRYTIDEELADDQEETGWKYIHGDIFRFPKNKSLLAACLGSGSQILALVVSVLVLALVGAFNPYNRGNLFSAFIIMYSLTSGIAGYTATSFYCQLEGTEWVGNLLLTGFLFFGPWFLAFGFLNTVATVNGITSALPFHTTVLPSILWILVTSLLHVLGGIIGKRSKTGFQAPCRTTKCPREIPPLRWYRRTIPQMALAGFLPFGAICLEQYYISATLWGFGFRTTYAIIFIVFIIILIITAFISIALTYFQLVAEDHKWWWRSLLSGGSTGIFMYAYSIYYYYARSNMTGFIQTSFFFGYMACICYGVFLMLGAVGFHISLLFVRHIYQSIKCE